MESAMTVRFPRVVFAAVPDGVLGLPFVSALFRTPAHVVEK